MKVAAITGTRSCALVERPEPRIKANFVKIKIMAAPMCTEWHAYRDGHATETIGHEAAGEVVEVAQPGRVKAGDRVVVMPQNPCGTCSLCLSGEYIHCAHGIDPHKICDSPPGRATCAQFCIQQDWMLMPIPAGMSYDHASMACCGLGPTFNACEMMQVDRFDTVLVAGLGPVGLGAVVNARYRGARVLAFESNPYRVALAAKMGVAAVIDPADKDAVQKINDLTDGHGADKSIETSSAQDAPAMLVKATRRKGQIASVGWGGPVMMNQIVGRGQTVHGAWHWRHQEHAGRMLATIAGSADLLDMHITHTFPMSRVGDAFELQLTGQCGKIILRPWE